MSSRTSCAVSTVTRLPSRTATALGEARMLSLSSVFFERSSCTMPMAVLTMMTPMNVRFSHCCTAITHSASRKNSILK